jgi:hypothetical protein
MDNDKVAVQEELLNSDLVVDGAPSNEAIKHYLLSKPDGYAGE